MDYLNSIWNILTKENEILTRILTAPTVIIEALLVFRLITFLFKIQYSTRQKVIYVFLFSFANLATEAIIPSPFNVFVNYLILFIITKFVLKTSHSSTGKTSLEQYRRVSISRPVYGATMPSTRGNPTGFKPRALTSRPIVSHASSTPS